MPEHVRHATENDLAPITALLLQDAAERTASDGELWPLAADATQRIAKAFSTVGRSGSSVRWLVVESGGVVVGVARLGVIPCPPIYHLGGGLAFVLFDDTYVSRSAPGAALVSLIAAAEREGEAMDAVVFLAAGAVFQREKRRALDLAGYRVVTNYLVKHRLSGGTLPSSARTATAADIPAIVAMGAKSQEELRRANAQMWTPHAEAPARFCAWMHYSLNLPDRRIFVSSNGELEGFVIAQPASSFHLPLTSEREHAGLIDDFWAPEFAPAAGLPESSKASDLLASAELEFTQRGRTSAVVICPPEWRPKQDFLRARGYGDGNSWMLKI